MTLLKRILSRVRTRRDRCPKCGSELMTDGHYVWCSQVPARDVATGKEVGGCTYGVRFLPVDEHERHGPGRRAIVVEEGGNDDVR